MEYKFSKDFLIYPGETDFDNIWEMFCCKLLNIEYKTTVIYRRKPPENGIDLFFPKNKFAYQCKSIETSESKGHNLTKIEKSYTRALEIQSELNWKQYYLCLNYDLTGIQEANLKKILPNVEILGKSYWKRLCEKYPLQVEDNFRISITISDYQISKTINDTFIPKYSTKLEEELRNDPYEILVYCNRNEKIYKLPVAKTFEVEDVINILKRTWNLPEPKDINGFKFGISYSLVFNNKSQPLNSKLSDLELTKDSVVTLWTTVRYSGNADSGNFIHLLTNETFMSKEDKLDNAMNKYEGLIKKAFEEFDEE